jgi:hypothetical protein
MVPKGSITVDGVSLTLVDVGSDFFSVALIPWTLAHTTLGERRVGDEVNLEIDLIGKYVYKYAFNSPSLCSLSLPPSLSFPHPALSPLPFSPEAFYDGISMWQTRLCQLAHRLRCSRWYV